jgi:endonuclease YncB( thermonuclease family)
MSSVLKNLALALICLVAANPASTQNPTEKKPIGDFSHDPCGNPLLESQLWHSIDGRVVSVKDGRTILIVAAEDQRRLRVNLAGIAAVHRGTYSDLTKRHVTEMILNKAIAVWVNPSKWDFSKKKPTEVTGVVYSQETAQTDVGLSLIGDGLARAEQPRPYTMSNYTFCRYRLAESEARIKMLGIWR